MVEPAPARRRPPSGPAAFIERRLPFWEPQLIVLVAILLDVVLPNKVTAGPRWLLPSLEACLLIGLVIASPHPRMRHSPLRRRIALGIIALVSAANVFSLVLLCQVLLQPAHGRAVTNGEGLILAGFTLWLTNVLLFGLWYWELDRGGPMARAYGPDDPPDFLFVQMTDDRWAPPGWRPKLVDYLYLSFTNATAFSPTDTMPLTPMAKWLMSAQSLTALVTVALVVSRAVNILS